MFPTSKLGLSRDPRQIFERCHTNITQLQLSLDFIMLNVIKNAKCWTSLFISQEVTKIVPVFVLKICSVPGSVLAAVFFNKSFIEEFLPSVQRFIFILNIYITLPEIRYHVDPTVEEFALNLNLHDSSVV